MNLKPLDNTTTYRSILLKGEPTSGKSWLASHMPNPVFLDFDKNQARLNKLPQEIKDNVRIIDPTLDDAGKPLKGRLVWANTLKILAWIKASLKDSTIIIDSATAFDPFILMKIASSEKSEEYGDLSFSNGRYQTLASYWEEFFSILTKDSDFKNHVVLIAHEKYSEVNVDLNNPKGDKKPVWKPSFTGAKTADTVEKYFTDVWRCFVDTSVKGKPRYMTTVIPTMSYKALSSLDLPGIFETSSQLSAIKDQLSFSSEKEKTNTTETTTTETTEK